MAAAPHGALSRDVAFVSPPFDGTEHDTPVAGSIAIIYLSRNPVAIVEARGLQMRVPWAPVCLCAHSFSEHERFISALESTHAAFARVICEGSAPTRSVLRSVSLRPGPSPSALASYITLRCRRPDLASTLRGIFDTRTVEPVHRTTVWRRLVGFGKLRPHDWSAIGRYVEAHSRGWSTGRRAVERVAHAQRLEARALRRWARRYFGLSAPETLKVPGWEWLVEIALRRHGYIRAPTPGAEAAARR